MKKAKRDGSVSIEFEPIPCPGNNGYIALSIREGCPFGRDRDYHVYVGGCGVGQERTLVLAKERLLAKAIESIQYRIHKSQHIADHYRLQLSRVGLRNEKRRRI